MLIKCKNPHLYRAWLRYLGEDNFLNRTQAYLNSEANKRVPMVQRSQYLAALENERTSQEGESVGQLSS